jgi:hypothetical protein
MKIYIFQLRRQNPYHTKLNFDRGPILGLNDPPPFKTSFRHKRNGVYIFYRRREC